MLTTTAGNRIQIAVAAVLLLLLMRPSSKAEAFSYHGQHDKDEWVGDCTIGLNQSPVSVSTEQSVPVSEDPLVFEFYDQTPKSDTLLNNGHSVTFKIEAVREINYPQVVGGGLPGVFQFEQLHFHWGSEDLRGSEHTIDQYRYPMELHAVHFNTKFGSNLTDALRNSNKAFNTLAVLAVMFEVQDEDNPLLKPIVDELEHVHYQNQITPNVTLFPLDNLLPHTTSKFFRYNGSLTTPPCSEVVVWTIFQEPIPISEDQLNKFRSLEELPITSNVNHHQSDNFRSTQPLNGRKIYLVDTSKPSSESPDDYNREEEVKAVVFYICILMIVVAFVVILVLVTLIVLYYFQAPAGVRTLDQRTGPNSYLPIRKSSPNTVATPIE